ncbi:MAG: serine--tRNA ligase [Planctomycetaceae bacterium]
MLDLQFLCEHIEQVATNCRNRGIAVDLDGLVAGRKKRSELIARVEQVRREQNKLSTRIPKESDPARKQELVARGKELRAQVGDSEAALKQVEAELLELQKRIPNLTHPDAPQGNSDTDNRVVRRWGEPAARNYQPLDHVALAEKHNLLDLEGGSRVAGHGFYFLKNEAVLLELALMQYACEKLVKEGFTLHSTPDLARDDVLEGTGYNPRGPETQIYSIQGTDLSLVATAEITLGGILKDQILDGAKLPILVAGISHCFRTEAGAHGRATRGIYRVHQFTKVEMFAFTRADQSEQVHQQIVRIEEELFQGLGIPYHVLDICAGDLGGPAYRKYDLEAWMPGRGTGGEFGEVTSASNCTDYQSRRLGIRYRMPDSKGTHFAHTLNGTAIACTRALIAILENYQQADGSIVVPEVLRKWVGKERIG